MIMEYHGPERASGQVIEKPKQIVYSGLFSCTHLQSAKINGFTMKVKNPTECLDYALENC
jgi:hypothetical protein